MRPALVCGWAISPSSSSTAMSLRIVAGDTPRLCRSARALLPTGSLVEMKSATMARSTSSLRSSGVIAARQLLSPVPGFQLRADRGIVAGEPVNLGCALVSGAQQTTTFREQQGDLQGGVRRSSVPRPRLLRPRLGGGAAAD